MSSAVLFDWFGIRAKQGNYVSFEVKTNLTAGFLYLIAAYGFINFITKKTNKLRMKL